MLSALKTCFIDKEDNLELASILGFLAFLVFIYLSYHAYVELKEPFDAQSWGIGAGGLAAGHGAGKLMGNKGDYGS